MKHIFITDAQRDVILAALRLWQATPDVSDEIQDIATNGGAHPPLSNDEIDLLCEQINV